MLEVAPLNISFLFVVALLYSALIMGALWANNRIQPENRWPVRWLRFFVGGYLLLIGMLALDGRYFRNFRDMPPHISVAIILSLLGTAFLAFNPTTLRWIREIPQRWLIGLQTFRILIELQLFFLAKDNVLPTSMTFEGRNFDILIGLSAPFVAWWVHKAHREGRGQIGLVTAWNVIGILMLTNVFATAILSFPTRLQVFTEPPGVLALTFFPWIWLPTFVVPLAYLLHVLSLRREWAFRKETYKSRLATHA